MGRSRRNRSCYEKLNQKQRTAGETNVESLPFRYSRCIHDRLRRACVRAGATCSSRRANLRYRSRVGLVVGSRQNLRCVFRSNTGRQYTYSGTIGRLGLDVGVTGGGRLFWAVFAPTAHVGKGTLRGNYVGASGSASFGLGLGANVLIGGSNRTISLQPLSVEGQVGVNLAVGVARLSLR